MRWMNWHYHTCHEFPFLEGNNITIFVMRFHFWNGIKFCTRYKIPWRAAFKFFLLGSPFSLALYTFKRTSSLATRKNSLLYLTLNHTIIVRDNYWIVDFANTPIQFLSVMNFIFCIISSLMLLTWKSLCDKYLTIGDISMTFADIRWHSMTLDDNRWLLMTIDDKCMTNIWQLNAKWDFS